MLFRSEPLADAIDVTRTVGWFTTVFPALLSLSDTGDVGADLRQIKETLRSTPRKGIGFGVLRYLARHQELGQAPTPQLAFNYLGQFQIPAQSGFGPASETPGDAIGGRNRRTHRIGVTAYVHSGRLSIDIAYSRNRFDDAGIVRLSSAMDAQLRDVLDHCMNPENTTRTPSDFDLVDLSQDEIDNIFA